MFDKTREGSIKTGGRTERGKKSGGRGGEPVTPRKIEH